MIKLAELPRFLLFAESELESFRDQVLGRWRFVLQTVGSTDRFDATDWEPDVTLQRLELLTVIRGLEELDQPSAVTILTPSDYVLRGVHFGLKEWRQTDWTWERFGDMVPITNDDLWRRFDRAAQIHRIACRHCQIQDSALDAASSHDRAHRSNPPARPARARQKVAAHGWVRRLSRIAASIVPI
jgi:ribonuclease HI